MDSPSLSESGKFLYHRYNLILSIEFLCKMVLKKARTIGNTVFYMFLYGFYDIWMRLKKVGYVGSGTPTCSHLRGNMIINQWI
jgi:hypothetical protein